MARLVLPSRLELKRPAGSSNEAPLAKVNFTLSLYVSQVQMIPACDHSGTPNIEFDGFLHFTSSTTSGSACLMSFRTRSSVSPRQSPSALICASIRREGEFSSFSFWGAVFPVVHGGCGSLWSDGLLCDIRHRASHFRTPIRRCVARCATWWHTAAQNVQTGEQQQEEREQWRVDHHGGSPSLKATKLAMTVNVKTIEDKA